MTDTWWQADCLAVNEKVKTEAQDRQAVLTKPLGSLGRLEEVAVTLASLYCDSKPAIKKPLITIFAADHGVVAQGVSAYPQAVTVEMIRNFVNGGAAISVLARFNQAQLSVVNCGTAFDIDFADSDAVTDAGAINNSAINANDINDGAINTSAAQEKQTLINTPVAHDTADFSVQSAMTKDELKKALRLGRSIVDQAKKDGIDLFIAGEMGIGNTTSASALGCAYLEHSVEAMTGRGTGIDDAGLKNKIAVIERSLERVIKEASVGKTMQGVSSKRILQELGGFEIAAMTGAYIRCAQLGIPALVDGFITTAAALAAYKMNPQVLDWLLFSHQSQEQGHQLILAALNAKPLLDLDLRLGEGSGAATALPILRQACALHSEMATFAEAAISGADTPTAVD